jgi:hypothetical protein
MKTVSFDFDGTLTRSHVQEYAKQLLNRGLNVVVVTSRYDDENAHLNTLYPKNNDDLWETIKQIGISDENVYFTNAMKKANTISTLNPVFHLDDLDFEIDEIFKICKNTVPLKVTKSQWQQKCEKLLLAPRKRLTKKQKMIEYFEIALRVKGIFVDMKTCETMYNIFEKLQISQGQTTVNEIIKIKNK